MNKSVYPNLFTGANLAFGALSIAFSATGRFEEAATCVLLSLLADGCDGRVARALGVSGPFGRELDSLADVIAFGLAPAFLLFSRELSAAGIIGYVPFLAMSVLGAFRLARFNIKTDEIHGYFQGLPIPTAGCLVATYVLSGVMLPWELTGIFTVVVALLMVSEVHYPDFKGKGADPNHPAALLVVAVLGASLLYADLNVWPVLPFALYTVFGICNTAANGWRR